MSVRCLVVRGRDSTVDVAGPLADHDEVLVTTIDTAVLRSDADTNAWTEAVDVGIDALVVAGNDALCALPVDTLSTPVIPVDTGAGRFDVAADEIGAVADALATGEVATVPHPVLSVAVDGTPAGRAVTDVTLMTADPARISEYSVQTGDGWRETVRSDGIVVATPLGSSGYARDVGGPLLAPETGVVAVPISPYAMNPDAWVLHPPVTLAVERDEAPVSLHLDDEITRSVPANAAVDVTVEESIALVRSPDPDERDSSA